MLMPRGQRKFNIGISDNQCGAIQSESGCKTVDGRKTRSPNQPQLMTLHRLSGQREFSRKPYTLSSAVPGSACIGATQYHPKGQ